MPYYFLSKRSDFDIYSDNNITFHVIEAKDKKELDCIIYSIAGDTDVTLLSVEKFPSYSHYYGKKLKGPEDLINCRMKIHEKLNQKVKYFIHYKNSDLSIVDNHDQYYD